jgi:hypothetical protein
MMARLLCSTDGPSGLSLVFLPEFEIVTVISSPGHPVDGFTPVEMVLGRSWVLR